MDETTPHMHFTFVPTVVSSKTGREKVHAKSVVDRKDLQTFHKDLDSYLKEHLLEIYKGGILNNKTMGIETVKEIKELDQQIITARKGRSKKLKALHRYQEPWKELKELKWNAKRSISGKIQLSEEEWSARSVIQDIRENGVPKNKKTMQSWLDILDKAKEKNILIEGLQLCIDLLTKGITKVIEKRRRISR